MAGSRSEREVKVRFTGESSVLQGSTSDVSKVFRMLSSDIADTALAGDRLAQAYEQVADSLRQDFKDTALAADVLKDSLGPEMVQALEASGRSVEGQVQEWRKLGLSYDDIMMSSDRLAASMKQLDDAARQSTGNIGDGMRKVAASTDQSRSVMANFAGNAMQELPGIAGTMGPLNMAMGQFAEYAAEGNISMSKFKTAAMGLGAASAAMWAISKGAEQAAERTQKITEAMEGLTSATDDQAISSFLNMLSMAMLNGKDATDQLNELAETNIVGARRMRDLGVEAGFTAEMLAALDQAIGEAEAETARAADTNEKYGNKVEETGNKAVTAAAEIDRGRDAIQRQTSAAKDAQDVQDGFTRALERNEEAQRSLTNMRMSAIDQEFAFRAAQDALTTSLEAYAVATDDKKTGVDEIRQSQDAAAQAARDLASAYQLSAEQLAGAAGVPLTAAQSQQKYIESLMQTAVALAPSSPLRAQLLGFINQMQSEVPAEKKTKLILEAEDANTRMGFHRQKTDEAKDAVADLQVKLDGLPGDIEIPINMPGIDAANAAADNLITKLRRLKVAADNANESVNRVIF